MNDEMIIIALYVDNILIFIKSQLLMNEIKRDIKEAFKMKNFGLVKRILDI